MGLFCSGHPPFSTTPHSYPRTGTSRDCFGVVVTGARGLRTCNKNKEKRMCRVTPPYSIRTAGAGPLVFIFFLAKPGLYPAGHSGSCLNFKGEGVTNYLPNSHQISSLLAANTKKLASRHNLKETYIKKLNVDWSSLLPYTCTRLWINQHSDLTNNATWRSRCTLQLQGL